MNRLKPQGLTITRCYMEGMWRDALSMTSFTKMWADGGERKPEEEEGQLTLKRKLEENQRPLERRENILGKNSRDILDMWVYVGNHHCQFSCLQEAAAAISLLVVMEQKRSLPDLPHEATVMLTAAGETVPFKWQKWWEWVMSQTVVSGSGTQLASLLSVMNIFINKHGLKMTAYSSAPSAHAPHRCGGAVGG